MRCLLLVGNGRRILIDTGIGDKFTERFADRYAVDHDAATLEGSLREAGVAPADVTDVILTHLHFDHCGGATTREGTRLKPTFPSATYYVQEDHWAWANDPNPKEKGSFLRENFRPIEKAGQLERVQPGAELAPGITVRTVDGHTEAQQMVFLSGEDETLVFVADLLPTTHHLAPAWTMAYDVRPLATIDEKARFLEEAAQKEWKLFFEHDPDVEVARVEDTEDGVQISDTHPLAAL
jgi:glyoxylase-like metal-dependent hydrolase (beta-lactamase superfamily II)